MSSSNLKPLILMIVIFIARYFSNVEIVSVRPMVMEALAKLPGFEQLVVDVFSPSVVLPKLDTTYQELKAEITTAVERGDSPTLATTERLLGIFETLLIHGARNVLIVDGFVQDYQDLKLWYKFFESKLEKFNPFIVFDEYPHPNEVEVLVARDFLDRCSHTALTCRADNFADIITIIEGLLEGVLFVPAEA